MDGVLSLAAILRDYGPWGLCAIEAFAIYALARELQKQRDSTERHLTDQAQRAIQLVETNTEASVEHRNALVRVADALRAVEGRLERVERRD